MLFSILTIFKVGELSSYGKKNIFGQKLFSNF